MAWKIYSVVFAVIVLSAPAALMSTDPTVFDYIDIVTSITAAVGLIGFAFRKAIGTEAFWRIASIVLAVWEVLYNVVISQVLGLGQRGIEGSIAAWLFGLAAFIAAYIGLFLYAYRRHDFWQTARPRSSQRLERTG
jgi:hypothetical protein